MTMRVGTTIVAALFAVAAAAAADYHHHHRVRHAAAARPSTPVDAARPSSTAVRTFADPAAGIVVCYPAAWRQATSATAELAVADPIGHTVLSLDVPAMRYHPIFIPLGIVAGRYVDALRQDTLPDAAVQESTDLTVAGASARRVTARGHHAGGTRDECIDTAVVIVHKGQVYILSCDSAPGDQQVARATLDAAVGSVRWTK